MDKPRPPRGGGVRSTKRTQAERLADAAIAAGPRGVTAVDFIRRPTIDGGAPILRLPARVLDARPLLAARGYDLVVDGKRDKCARYVARRRQPAGHSAAVPECPMGERAPVRRDVQPANAILGWDA